MWIPAPAAACFEVPAEVVAELVRTGPHWRGGIDERDGAEGIRTPGLLNAIQALFQLSYSPRKFKFRG
jgi:hypothetical protein